jgi:hypothetical protein
MDLTIGALRLLTAGVVVRGAGCSNVGVVMSAAAFVEQHTEALEAALQLNSLMEVRRSVETRDECMGPLETDSAYACVPVVRQMINLLRRCRNEPEFLRAGTYAVAVMCGHTHRNARPLLKDYLSRLRGAENSNSNGLIDALWELINATTDPVVESNVLLAIRHLIPLATETPQLEYVLKLVAILEQALAELTGARDVPLEDDRRMFEGLYSELASAAMLSLLDALVEPTMMEGALELTFLARDVEKLMHLPVMLGNLTMLGLELAELMGSQQKYDAMLLLADSLGPLLQREGQEGQLRILRILACLAGSEPDRIATLANYGLIGALFQTFARFKQTDAVLIDVYGVVECHFNLEVVEAAVSILRTLIVVADARCRSLFIGAFSVKEVQAVLDLHKVMSREVAARTLFPSQSVVDLNSSLRALLSEMQDLHADGKSTASKAVRQLLAEGLGSWREDLALLWTSPHTTSMPDPLDLLDGHAQTQQLIRCMDPSGRPVDVHVVPCWPGGREVTTPVPTTASLGEFREHLYDLYHIPNEAMRLFHLHAQGRYELGAEEPFYTLLALYADGKEPLVVQLVSSLSVALQPQVVVTAELKSEMVTRASEITQISPQVSAVLSRIYALYDRIGLENPAARGLTWDRFQAFVQENGGRMGPHLRLMWEILDNEGQGWVPLLRFGEAVLTFTFGMENRRLEFVFLSYTRGSPHMPREMFIGLFQSVNSDRPGGDARRMAEQILLRCEVDVQKALDLHKFVEVVNSEFYHLKRTLVRWDLGGRWQQGMGGDGRYFDSRPQGQFQYQDRQRGQGQGQWGQRGQQRGQQHRRGNSYNGGQMMYGQPPQYFQQNGGGRRPKGGKPGKRQHRKGGSWGGQGVAAF